MILLHDFMVKLHDVIIPCNLFHEMLQDLLNDFMIDLYDVMTSCNSFYKMLQDFYNNYSYIVYIRSCNCFEKKNCRFYIKFATLNNFVTIEFICNFFKEKKKRNAIFYYLFLWNVARFSYNCKLYNLYKEL